MSNDTGRYSINLALQMTEKTAKIIAVEVNAIANLLEAIASFDRNAAKLLKYKEKHGDLEYTLCDKTNTAQFENKLRQENILYYKMANATNPSQTIFLYPDCYENRVKEITKDYMVRNGLINVVSKEDLIRTYHGNDIQSLDRLNKNEVEIMKNLMHNKPVAIAFTPSSEQGKYKMYFHASNQDEIKRTLLQEKILTANRSASYVAKTIEFDLAHKGRLYERMRDNEKDHYYIMGEDRSMIEINKNGFAYRGEDGNYIIMKSDPQMEEKAYATISRMQRPIELTREEFQACKTDEKKQKELFNRKIVDEKYPDYNQEIARELRELERKTSLVEKKMAMENPDHQLSEYDLFNDQMTFTAFEAEENRNMTFEDWKNDMDEKEIQDIHKAFAEYKIENEEINFSEYQILYEQDRRDEKVPFFLRDNEEHDSIQDYKDEMERNDFSHDD